MVAPALVRQMASDSPETPLSKFMPQIAAIPRQTFNAIVGLAGSAIIGTATSGPVKSLVSSFADKLVLDEAIVKIEDLDPSYWAYWLASTGYSSSAGENGRVGRPCRSLWNHITQCLPHAGFKKLGDAAKAKAASFSAEQITSLVTGLHS